MADDCSHNTDPLKLVREGTSQDRRATAALDPATAPVNARGVADNIVFARNYAAGLKHYGPTNTIMPGGWRDFFSKDAAVPLAVAAIEDIESYKTAVRSWFDFLNNLENAGQANALKDNLGYLFAVAGSLARALDHFTHSLPDTVALKGTTQNLISTQLAPALTRLIGYYRGGVGLTVINAVAPTMKIFGDPVVPFHTILTSGLSRDWTGGATWTVYLATISPDASVYGPGGAPDPFVRINHCSTHNLFRSVFDQFLRVFARVGNDAQNALDILLNAPGHAPHYALYLAFLQLAEYARSAGNRLTQRHLDFYYRVILGLKESPPQPGHVHLTAELAKQADSFDFAAGTLFKAGKDSAGKDAFFANAADFVANRASIAALKTVYRHGAEPITSGDLDNGRIFASPVANSDDGQGAALTSVDKSWHPFFNNIYVDGNLSRDRHAYGEYRFRRRLALSLCGGRHAEDHAPARCRRHTSIIGAEGFHLCRTVLVHDGEGLAAEGPGFVRAREQRSPARCPAGGCRRSRHALRAEGSRIQFRHRPSHPAGDARAGRQGALRPIPDLQDVEIATANLTVDVKGMKTLPVATDFGPVDLSKPFQPFGSSPAANSALVVGSTEIFQKTLTSAEVDINWQAVPVVFTGTSMPTVSVDFLKGGVWKPSTNTAVSIAPASGNAIAVPLTQHLGDPVVVAPDFTPDAPYTTQARHGFLRLVLSGGIGQAAYQAALIAYLLKIPGVTTPGPTMPPGPMAAALTMSYVASTTLVLNSAKQPVFDAARWAVLPSGTFRHGGAAALI